MRTSGLLTDIAVDFQDLCGVDGGAILGTQAGTVHSIPFILVCEPLQGFGLDLFGCCVNLISQRIPALQFLAFRWLRKFKLEQIDSDCIQQFGPNPAKRGGIFGKLKAARMKGESVIGWIQFHASNGSACGLVTHSGFSFISVLAVTHG